MNIYDVAELQKYLNPQGINPMNFQGAFRTNVPLNPMDFQGAYPTDFPTGITASSAAIPFENDPIAIAQGFVRNTPSDQGTNFQFLPSANEADETDEVVETKTGIAKLFDFLSNFIPGVGLLKRLGNVPGGIQNTDFAQSKTLADYFAKKRNKRFTGQDDPQGGAITTFRNVKQRAQDKIDDRGRGQIPSRTTRAPKRSSSNVYSEAKRSFFRD
tara:strand:+ start:45 stop:686 length:642 start_codon:yes stop_codon:yes gene_type:complete